MASLLDATSTIAPDGAGALARDLEAGRLVIETRFLAAGDLLSKAIEAVSTLIALLDRMAAALNAQVAAETTQDLKAAAAELSALPASHAGRQAAVSELSRCRSVLGERVGEMRRNLTYMRNFTINIKITAAGVSGADLEFGVFAQDIQHGIRRGSAELERLEGDLSSLSEMLATAQTQGDTLGSRIDELFPAAPQQIVASADVLAEHQKRLAETAEGAAGVARDIRVRVCRILAALQVGDSTRQRIEHVQAGLDDMVAYATMSSDPNASALVAPAHALLAAQLAATAADFRREVREIGANMADMAGGATELLRLKDMAHGRGQHGDAGFLRSLEGRLMQAHILVSEMQAADQAALHTGVATAGAAQALADRVAAIQTIKTDVQYMALNTALKCSRMGKAGAPLSAIATELRAHGALLEALAVDTLGVLSDLGRCAAALAQDDPNATRGERATTAAAGALGIATGRIRDASQSAETNMAAFARQGRSLVDMLEKSSGDMELQREIGELLDDGVARLQRLGYDARAFPADPDAPLGRLLSAFSGRYTMGSEREVHRAFLESWGLGAAAAPPTVEADPLEGALF